MTFDGARARVAAATGLAGDGVTTGEMTTAISDALTGLEIPANITDLDDVDLTGVADGDYLKSVGGQIVKHTPTGATVFTTATFLIDGGGVAITTGVKGDLEIPFAGTIIRARAYADQVGSMSVGIWKDTYANYPPTSDDLVHTVTVASGANKASASGLTIPVALDDILRFNVTSVTSITRLTISLLMTRSVGP